MQGPWQAFTYNVPNPDGTTSAVLVTLSRRRFRFEYLRNAAQCRIESRRGGRSGGGAEPTRSRPPVCGFLERTCDRAAFGGPAVVPLVHIRLREGAAAPRGKWAPLTRPTPS